MKAILCCLAWMAATASAWATPGDVTVVDDFHDAAPWSASASDQVQGSMRMAEGRGMCLDYNFTGVSGYATLRRKLAQPITLPPNYEFRLRLSSQGRANQFQFKLLDATGDNVWWAKQENFRYGPKVVEKKFRARQIEFAWGPTADKTLRRFDAIELVVATAAGSGKGNLCFDRIELVERAPAPATWPAPVITPAGGDGVDADFSAAREFSGVQVRWPAGQSQRPRNYALQTEEEDGQWKTIANVRDGAGPLDAIYTPDAEARRLRLRVAEGTPPAARAALSGAVLEPMDPKSWKSLDAATSARAKSLPAGLYPRAYLGQQNYWTIFGTESFSKRVALISEDGAIEPMPGGPSIEPFILLEGPKGAAPRLVTWADVKTSHSLPDGYLPLPRVRWTHPDFTLDIDAGADTSDIRSFAFARYTFRPTGRQPLKATLLLVTRPCQVNPPQQFLNQPGGAAPLRSALWTEGNLMLNGNSFMLKPVPAPARIAVAGGDDLPLAQTFAQAGDLHALAAEEPWAESSGRGEVAMAFPLTAAAGRDARVGISWLITGQWEPPGNVAGIDAKFTQSAADWRKRLNTIDFSLPTEARPLQNTLRSAMAQILLSRNSVVLQPGTRSYARTWVRDGAMMVSALLRTGQTRVADDYVEWYTKRLFDSGKVPCCLDQRGADPVPENDSSGELIHMTAEVWRYTQDKAALERRWPAIEKAVRYMESLRQSERTDANRQPGREAFFGLMPASISHEGYSEKPMHSYWDDFWALRGYKDAVLIAQAAGHEDTAREFAAWRDEFAQELEASLRVAARQHGIAYVPGAAELGDFDPTSTTVVLNPADASSLLQPMMLESTFERYWRESQQRAGGVHDWKDYTPYELRSVGALIRMGQPERATDMLDFFLKDQRPAGWNQWAEVVMRDPREVHFLGDMPHGWVASDAMRSILDMFVFDVEDGNALVIGAGLPEEWMPKGVGVRHMPTPFGPLSYRLKETPQGLKVQIDAGVKVPPGGIRVRWQGLEKRFMSLPANAVMKR